MGVPYAEVIGDPVEHSKSPRIHRFWLKKLDLAGDYRAVRVTAGELAGYLRQRRGDPDWRGCNVTMPLKPAIVPLLDEVEGGVPSLNCVIPRGGSLVGFDTDSAGIAEATGNWVFDRTESALCLIGAGGAARAFIASLPVQCAFDLRVMARDPRKGARLLESFGAGGSAFWLDEAERALVGCTAVINASPLGMTGFPPMPEALLDSLCGLRRGGYVLDMVTSPVETALLRRAREAGLTIADGLAVLIGQARRAFERFYGLLPTRACDPDLRALLAP
ncbi:MAG TPA: shikimate dehydrogenase [Allosphingosinicella sp.]|nr:shikimate dehydrogenase [Allosphingosinicella sp.]